MKIAVIGSGGREHTIAWKLSQHTQPENIYVIPGNGGTQNNVNISVTNFERIKFFCKEKKIDLILVGPEVPLVEGIVDYFKDTNVQVFGPDTQAAQLEGSKIYSKKFMQKYGVATSDAHIFENGDVPDSLIKEMNGELVFKYDGLAAGKGVFVCSSVENARENLKQLKREYGADSPVLVEEKMTGLEISIIGFTDGRSIKMLLPSQDHKPIYDGDEGPNTGGMGAYCPVPFCDDKLLKQIDAEVVQPTLRGIQQERLNFKGVIYFGLMITDDGPKVLEYNVRLGDPETEVILPALKSNFLTLIKSCMDGTLADFEMQFHDGYFVDVVLASGGYPNKYEKGFEISGLDKLSSETMLFHAGTKRDNGKIVTSGGRVLNVVRRADDLKTAIQRTYSECQKILFKNKYNRTDIGMKGLSS
ncbi:phosphoribosylamine--glycine ligase [candidate division KSB1 bacterium]|nr:phosphoribosylamine--glycine ligase [candidate division KSB1 bacterium]